MKKLLLGLLFIAAITLVSCTAKSTEGTEDTIDSTTQVVDTNTLVIDSTAVVK